MNADRTEWPQCHCSIDCQWGSFSHCCLMTSLIDKSKIRKSKTPRSLIVFCFRLFSVSLSWLLTKPLYLYLLNLAPCSSLTADEIKY